MCAVLGPVLRSEHAVNECLVSLRRDPPARVFHSVTGVAREPRIFLNVPRHRWPPMRVEAPHVMQTPSRCSALLSSHFAHGRRERSAREPTG